MALPVHGEAIRITMANKRSKKRKAVYKLPKRILEEAPWLAAEEMRAARLERIEKEDRRSFLEQPGWTPPQVEWADLTASQWEAACDQWDNLSLSSSTMGQERAGNLASLSEQIAFRARTELDETLDQVREDAIEAWEALVTAQAQIRSFEVEVSASQIALEGVREENTVGERTVLDVLDAEQELLDAQVALVRAQRDGLVANYAVLQAMGILTAEALELSVDLYDDSKNYNQVRDQWFGTDVSIEGE